MFHSYFFLFSYTHSPCIATTDLVILLHLVIESITRVPQILPFGFHPSNWVHRTRARHVEELLQALPVKLYPGWFGKKSCAIKRTNRYNINCSTKGKNVTAPLSRGELIHVQSIYTMIEERSTVDSMIRKSTTTTTLLFLSFVASQPVPESVNDFIAGLFVPIARPVDHALNLATKSEYVNEREREILLEKEE